MTRTAGNQDSLRTRRWSDVFRRSTLSPVVFNVERSYSQLVCRAVESTGLPVTSHSSMFSDGYRSAAVLDGFMLELLTYGFPAGRLQSGVRIVGHSPMRLVCELVGIRPPSRRLGGEQAVPTPQDLLRALEQQLLRPNEELQARAELGLGVYDTDSLLQLVREAFGDGAVPPALLERLRLQERADDEWGDEGFTAGERQQALSAGIPLPEAAAWKELGCNLEEATFLREHSVEVLRPWVEAGVTAGQASGYLRDGRSLDEIRPYLDVGVPSGWVQAFLDAGFGPEVYSEFIAEGFVAMTACGFAAAGQNPDQARQWLDLGIGPYQAREVLGGGGTLEDARRLVAQGEPVRSVVDRFR